MKTHHVIAFGDARSMSLIHDGSVHLIVTSPPYWQLKDYESDNQIGFDHSYEEYINNLNLVWKECHRVLHDGCRLCINIGDQFARSVYYGRYKVIPIRTEVTRFCETIGFDFMGSIIWQKVTTCNTTGGASIMGSFPYPRNGIVKIDYEFILLFKKHGQQPKIDPQARKLSELTNEEWNLYFNGHWNFPGERQAEHLAMFPEELPKRLIRMFSFVGETVLDPFLGSGTTTLSAMKLGRNSVGYEINSGFHKIIEKKLNSQSDLFLSSVIEYRHDPSRPTEADLKSLPYVFIDPLMLDKKTDPRKLTFGSKFNSESTSTKQYHNVKKIIAADEVVLDNELTVKLLGIEPVREREQEAVRFLEQMVKGKQVSLSFDRLKYDDSQRLMVYMYLRNRTFVNAHLVKHGFARVRMSDGVTNKTLQRFSE